MVKVPGHVSEGKRGTGSSVDGDPKEREGASCHPCTWRQELPRDFTDAAMPAASRELQAGPLVSWALVVLFPPTRLALRRRCPLSVPCLFQRIPNTHFPLLTALALLSQINLRL